MLALVDAGTPIVSMRNWRSHTTRSSPQASVLLFSGSHRGTTARPLAFGISFTSHVAEVFSPPLATDEQRAERQRKQERSLDHTTDHAAEDRRRLIREPERDRRPDTRRRERRPDRREQ
jgi:hypothetical protein